MPTTFASGPGAGTPPDHLPIDPRFRARRVEIRRAEGRRRLRMLLSLVVAVAVVAGIIGLLHTPLARVRHIRVSGEGALPRQSVLAAAGISTSSLMVNLDLARAERGLDALPAVATATVTRQWPSTVEVSLSQRSPVAVVSGTWGRAVLDRTGRVLAVGPAAGAGLPVLVAAVTPGAPGSWVAGTAGPGVAALEQTAPGSPAAAGSGPVASELALAVALPGSLRSQITREVIDPHDGLVAWIGNTRIVFGDTTDLASKTAGLEALASHAPLAQATRVDLRVADRPVVVPASLTSTGSGH